MINIEKSEPVLGGISIEYSDCFDIVKDATFVLDKMNHYTWEKASIDEVAEIFSKYLMENRDNEIITNQSPVQTHKIK